MASPPLTLTSMIETQTSVMKIEDTDISDINSGDPVDLSDSDKDTDCDSEDISERVTEYLAFLKVKYNFSLAGVSGIAAMVRL